MEMHHLSNWWLLVLLFVVKIQVTFGWFNLVTADIHMSYLLRLSRGNLTGYLPKISYINQFILSFFNHTKSESTNFDWIKL